MGMIQSGINQLLTTAGALSTIKRGVTAVEQQPEFNKWKEEKKLGLTDAAKQLTLWEKEQLKRQKERTETAREAAIKRREEDRKKSPLRDPREIFKNSGEDHKWEQIDKYPYAQPPRYIQNAKRQFEQNEKFKQIMEELLKNPQDEFGNFISKDKEEK